MTSDPIFKAFNTFALTACLPKQRFRGACFVDSRTSMTKPPAALPRRLRAPPLPSSVVAHAVVELETQLIELTMRLAARE